jgi:DNA-directed RNA polymerase subunit F
MKVISSECVSAPDAKKILEERKKDKELVYEQKICLDYLAKAYKITPTQLANFKNDLGKIAILKPRYISLIINIMPDTEKEVEMLFSKERTNLKKDEIKQIVDIVKKYKK